MSEHKSGQSSGSGAPTTDGFNPDRLGDVLIRQKCLAPHQIGVALEVQRRTRLPLGRILLETKIISRPRLWLALLQQKLSRQLPLRRKDNALYGFDLVRWAQARLENHMKAAPDATSQPSQTAEIIRLRSELAGLQPSIAGRIVEKDDVLKDRLITGNF